MADQSMLDRAQSEYLKLVEIAEKDLLDKIDKYQHGLAAMLEEHNASLQRSTDAYLSALRKADSYLKEP